jgi:hypothetical protein
VKLATLRNSSRWLWVGHDDTLGRRQALAAFVLLLLGDRRARGCWCCAAPAPVCVAHTYLGHGQLQREIPEYIPHFLEGRARVKSSSTRFPVALGPALPTAPCHGVTMYLCKCLALPIRGVLPDYSIIRAPGSRLLNSSRPAPPSSVLSSVCCWAAGPPRPQIPHKVVPGSRFPGTAASGRAASLGKSWGRARLQWTSEFIIL